VLIAAESGSGQDGEARADLQKFLATAQLLDGLRRAGMPAE
jgi:hypothetical protein